MKKIGFIIPFFLLSCSSKQEGCNHDDNGRDSTCTLSESITKPISNLFVGCDPKLGEIDKQIFQELDSDDVYNSHIIYGFWFTPHAASLINVFLHTDDKFEFHDSSEENGQLKEIYKVGSFEIKNDSVYLKATDGWTKALAITCNGGPIYLTRGNEDNWEYYLVKGTIK